MIERFEPDELPGGSHGPYSATDVTSFQDIWIAAATTLNRCMAERDQFGWMPLDKKPL